MFLFLVTKRHVRLVRLIINAETNQDECDKNLFNIQGYQPSIYQSKINGKSKGSGFVIYVREPFLFTVTEEYNECSPNLESLFITISNTEKRLTIGVVYRPPNGNKFDALSEFHTLIKKLPSSNVHINGDFNIDLQFA